MLTYCHVHCLVVLPDCLPKTFSEFHRGQLLKPAGASCGRFSRLGGDRNGTRHGPSELTQKAEQVTWVHAALARHDGAVVTLGHVPAEEV